MRLFRLLALAALVMFGAGTFAASGAHALEQEEESNPRILVLEGKASELLATLKGGSSSILLLGGLNFMASAEELSVKTCAAVAGHEKDTNLCTDATLDITGVKTPLVACRSENSKGEKDAIETVLALLDLHVAAELTAAKTLQPLLVAKLLGTALEEGVTLVCGGGILPLKGVIACLLLPGLENIPTTSNVEVVCKVNGTTHDRETGTCTILCEDLGEIGLTLAGDDTWWGVTLKGKVNKDVFIDD